MTSHRASRRPRRAVWEGMMRRTFLVGGVLAGLLLGSCSTASRAPAHKEAMRANAISNKHILSEEPTLERPAPRVVPAAMDTLH